VSTISEYAKRVYDLILESLDLNAADGLSGFYDLPQALFREGAARVIKHPLAWLSLPILTCEALGGDLKAAYYVAAAWEVGYRAAGYLDEWQDQDTDDALWRSIGPEQTVNLTIGLIGLSSSILYRLRELDAVSASTILDMQQEFNRTLLHMVEGQHADLRDNLSLEDYQAVAAAKTGAQWRLATRSGALVAGAGPEVAACYGDYGRALGLLFQAWNDLYGLSGADGKRDREHQRSLPVLAASEMKRDRTLDVAQELVGGQIYTIVQIEMLHQRAAEVLARCPEAGRLALFLDNLTVAKVLGDVA
jgi:hypothetical protein